MKRYGFSCLVALGVLFAATLSSGLAQAQAELETGDGMDLHLFRPAVDSKGFFSVNGTDILGANDISFGLAMDLGVGLLEFNSFEDAPERTGQEAQLTDRVVDWFFSGVLKFNYGIENMFVVGAQIPVHLVGGQNIAVPEYYNSFNESGLSLQSIGNLTLHGKARILHVGRHPIGLAGIVHIELPTGSPESFAGEPGFSLWPVLAAEWQPVRPVRVGLNVGYRFNAGEGARMNVGGTVDGSTFPNATCGARGMNNCVISGGQEIQYDDLITFGLGLSFRVAPVVDIVLEGYGTQLISEFNGTGLSMEAIGGLKIFVQRNSYLALGGGIGIPTDGFQKADVRGHAAFIFEPSIGDRDGDGYKDDVDQCPDDPEDFDDFADADGCPDPDNDRDGILDVDDDCPMIPEDRDGDSDEDGCPEGTEGDRDGDGIPDAVDQCPDDPEDLDGFQDEDGCPDPDNDQDGILDVDDLCPNDPEDKDGWQDEDGCPDPDNDADRILDVDDACPNDPEVYNGHEDEDGCPDEGLAAISGDEILIFEKIYFETDSAVIMNKSFPVVDAVAATLNGNPQILLVEVQGHADERATDSYNIKLTRDRAASVVEALMSRGVEASRLRSAGYGERCPIDKGHNKAAWEKNRRVEFKILRTDVGPTGVEVACPAGRDLVPN